MANYPVSVKFQPATPSHGSSIFHLNGWEYEFETAAAKRLVRKLIKKGYTISQAFAWEGDLPGGNKWEALQKASQEEIEEFTDGSSAPIGEETEKKIEAYKGLVSSEELEIFVKASPGFKTWFLDRGLVFTDQIRLEDIIKAFDQGLREEDFQEVLDRGLETDRQWWWKVLMPEWVLTHFWQWILWLEEFEPKVANAGDLLEWVLEKVEQGWESPAHLQAALDAGMSAHSFYNEFLSGGRVDILEEMWDYDRLLCRMAELFGKGMSWETLTFVYDRKVVWRPFAEIYCELPEWVTREVKSDWIESVTEVESSVSGVVSRLMKILEEGWSSPQDYALAQELGMNMERFYLDQTPQVEGVWDDISFHEETILVEKEGEGRLTEVIPYIGIVGLVCSQLTTQEDPRWSKPESKIWASLRNPIRKYGEYTSLVYVNTQEGGETYYTAGQHDHQWRLTRAWGIDSRFEGVGAISYENRLTSKVVPLGQGKAFPKPGFKGSVKVGGEKANLHLGSKTWILTWENGLTVRGEQGLSEVLAYLRGDLKTQEEEGCPLWLLWLGRMISLIVCWVKSRGEGGRAAGYKWLTHYLLGSGKDRKMPSEWVEPSLERMLEKKEKTGRVVWSSTDWCGRGFGDRPAGFYTVGGFIGYVKEGLFEFEDVYDWHPMKRSSPTSNIQDQVWCWSEMDLSMKIVDMVKNPLLKKALSRVLGEYENKTVMDMAQAVFGKQYFGHSEFFGVSGVSNKFWNDLQKVGARPFKTVYKTKI